MNKFMIAMLSSAMIAGAAIAHAAPLPEVVTGGVGIDGQKLIAKIQNNYNTKLVFTGAGGAYLSDVKVDIRDKSGLEWVAAQTDGPVMLTDLKPGKYTVHATAAGFDKKQNIVVGKNLKTYQIQFPIHDEVARVQSPATPEDIIVTMDGVTMSFPG